MGSETCCLPEARKRNFTYIWKKDHERDLESSTRECRTEKEDERGNLLPDAATDSSQKQITCSYPTNPKEASEQSIRGKPNVPHDDCEWPGLLIWRSTWQSSAWTTTGKIDHYWGQLVGAWPSDCRIRRYASYVVVFVYTRASQWNVCSTKHQEIPKFCCPTEGKKQISFKLI